MAIFWIGEFDPRLEMFPVNYAGVFERRGHHLEPFAKTFRINIRMSVDRRLERFFEDSVGPEGSVQISFSDSKKGVRQHNWYKNAGVK